MRFAHFSLSACTSLPPFLSPRPPLFIVLCVSATKCTHTHTSKHPWIGRKTRIWILYLFILDMVVRLMRDSIQCCTYFQLFLLSPFIHSFIRAHSIHHFCSLSKSSEPHRKRTHPFAILNWPFVFILDVISGFRVLYTHYDVFSSVCLALPCLSIYLSFAFRLSAGSQKRPTLAPKRILFL